eukprot:4532294-Lingulodinium_polyedra.AAC.1
MPLQSFPSTGPSRHALPASTSGYRRPSMPEPSASATGSRTRLTVSYAPSVYTDGPDSAAT